MNALLPNSVSQARVLPDIIDPERPKRSIVSWGAILAGTMAGLASYVLFMFLAAGLGLAIYSPLTEETRWPI